MLSYEKSTHPALLTLSNVKFLDFFFNLKEKYKKILGGKCNSLPAEKYFLLVGNLPGASWVQSET